MENKEILKEFIRTQYSDEKLAVAIKVCEEDHFKYLSCCCFIGLATTDHPNGEINYNGELGTWASSSHYDKACLLPGAIRAERAARELAIRDDIKRGQILLSLFKEEQERRNACKQLIEMKEGVEQL